MTIRSGTLTTFAKNREAAADGDVFTKFMTRLLQPFSGQTTIVGRAFFGGRNANRSLGFAEELSSQGRWQ